jgi:hypothetical protein
MCTIIPSCLPSIHYRTATIRTAGFLLPFEQHTDMSKQNHQTWRESVYYLQPVRALSSRPISTLFDLSSTYQLYIQDRFKLSALLKSHLRAIYSPCMSPSCNSSSSPYHTRQTSRPHISGLADGLTVLPRTSTLPLTAYLYLCLYLSYP